MDKKPPSPKNRTWIRISLIFTLLPVVGGVAYRFIFIPSQNRDVKAAGTRKGAHVRRKPSDLHQAGTLPKPGISIVPQAADGKKQGTAEERITSPTLATTQTDLPASPTSVAQSSSNDYPFQRYPDNEIPAEYKRFAQPREELLASRFCRMDFGRLTRGKATSELMVGDTLVVNLEEGRLSTFTIITIDDMERSSDRVISCRDIEYPENKYPNFPLSTITLSESGRISGQFVYEPRRNYNVSTLRGNPPIVLIQKVDLSISYNKLKDHFVDSTEPPAALRAPIPTTISHTSP